MKPLLVILLGPTAVGKTAISLDIAEQLQAEIVSADSMLIYKKMLIGTAKPTPEELNRIPHHLIDIIEPNQPFSVADYCLAANRCIQDILKRNRLPMLVGGTALYLKAFTERYTFPDLQTDLAVRDFWHAKALEFGNEFVHQQLAKVDKISAAKLHCNDLRRVIRALEVYELTGIPLSKQAKKERNLPYHPCVIGLNRDRQELYARINLRVDEMIKDGLVEEVAGLLQQGYSRELTAMQGLGYKEIAAYLAGECTLDRAIEILKRDTRHFAKRQLTWFRNDPQIKWFDLTAFSEKEIIAQILNYIAEINCS